MPIMQAQINAFTEQTEVLATMDIGKMWDRLLGEFLGEWDRLNRQNLSAADMERELLAFMEDLSEKPMEDLARQSSSVAYNQGRGASILGASSTGQVEFVVRSEVLDSKTCEECARLDGSVVEVDSSPGSAYWEFMPPAKCLGGDRCRGFYIPVGRGAG